MNKMQCDLLVIGGGINGAGIARDAIGRGLSVIVCEKDDLASHTSSASSKLIHGGLRYLEYYEFGLVRKALLEREVLMRIAPHLIFPLRFVMPYVKGLRPRWLLRMGLFFYDHMARRELLPGTESLQLRQHVAGESLKSFLRHGFAYSDAWVDDARLVVLNMRDAAERGATVLTRTCCEKLVRTDHFWNAYLSRQTQRGTQELVVEAKAIVNATGAWAASFQHLSSGHIPQQNLRFVQGSHIMVKRLFNHDQAYIFQHPDGRIVFAIPYGDEFTVLGTTDLEYRGDINQVHISEAEIDYLCALSNEYFLKQITRDDVVWSYSGVRPLVDDGTKDAKKITRDYRLELDVEGAPILHVFGGKVTTYRHLAEDALRLLAPLLQCQERTWTATAVLPGGDIASEVPSNQSVRGMPAFILACQTRYAWLPLALTKRYAKQYGTKIHQLLAGATCIEHLGECVLNNLYEREISYLIQYEFALQASDILWRRTKLGLYLGIDAEAVLNQWLKDNQP
jgi:glycerol-3-phosphate dehydrogenase